MARVLLNCRQTHDVKTSQTAAGKPYPDRPTDTSTFGGRLHQRLYGCHILLVANKTGNSGPFCPDTLSMKFLQTFRRAQSLRRIVIEEIDLDAGFGNQENMK
jgi:hypothetical protein